MQLAELRKQLKAVSAEYKIVKNRLARLALTCSSLSGLSAKLKGPTGLVLAKGDPVSVAKTLTTFARTNQALVVKVGVVDGQVLQPEGLKALADLPSRDALRAQIAGALAGPAGPLVGLLQAPQRNSSTSWSSGGKPRGRREAVSTKGVRPAGAAAGRATKRIRRTRNSAIRGRDHMANVEQIAEELDKLTLLEAAQLRKMLQEKWGVSAAAPVAVAAMPGAGGGGRRGRGRRGEDRVRRHADGGGREEDPGHQGRPRAHRPRAEGSQGSRGRRAEGR